MLHGVSSTGIHVYLTDEQRRRIETLRRAEGIPLAEVVRRALDDYLERQTSDAEAALSTAFGTAPGASAPSRDEWDRGERPGGPSSLWKKSRGIRAAMHPA